MTSVEADVQHQPTGTRLTVFFDADCGFCSWCATSLDRLDRRRRLRLVPLQSAAGEIADPPAQEKFIQALHVRDREGHWERGGRACLLIAAEVPALWPLAIAGRLPIVRAGVEPFYRVVAQNRHRIGRLLGVGACIYRPTSR